VNDESTIRRKTRPDSLSEVASRIRAGEEPRIAIGEFLDAYYAADPGDRPQYLAEEPESVSLPDSWLTQVTDAYLSAVAEALAYRDKFVAPSWIFQSKFFLDRPWFASSIDGLRPLLIMESPVFFRRRNLFVSKNALSRA